jgi:hypothetical protein
MQNANMTRRRALGALGMSAAATASAGATGAQSGPALDWSRPETQMAALIRMRGALDDRLVVSFLEGVYYGVMETRLTPLYGLSAGLFRRYRARADGGYDYLNFELVYVTDLDTGGLLQSFTNPYSGKTGKPPQTRLGPSRLTITPARAVVRPGPAQSAVAFHRFRPAQIVGDDVWIVEESAVRAPAPMNFAFNEVLTYRAGLADLAAAGSAHVTTHVHFTPVIGWRPWQGMEGHEAALRSHVTGSCAGRVVTSLNDLPARYLRWTEELHPDVLQDPLALLGPFENTG